MHEILIVEDEYTERRELVSLMKELTGPEHIRSAATCEAAIQMIAQRCPDLILLDIMLKGRSGFEVAQFVHSHGLGCRIIILTAYNEFDFASKAMSMGIRDYLLKPMRPDLLIQRIRGMLNVPVAGGGRDGVLWPCLACGMTHGLPEPLPVLPARVMVGLLSAPLTWKEEKEICCRAEVSLQGAGRLECYGDRVVCYCRQEDDTCPEEEAGRVLSMWKQLLPGRCRLNRVGLGVWATSAKELAESYHTACLATRSGALFPERTLCCYVPGEEAPKAYPVRLENKIICALRSGTAPAEAAIQLCNQMLSDCCGNVAVLERWVEMYCGALSKACGEAGQNWMPALHLEECLTPEVLAGRMKELAERAAERIVPADHSGRPLVRHTVEIIHSRYQEPLKLESIAREQFVNPAYLGRIFHAHIGQTFRDYLTQVRMQHAARLLSEGSTVSSAAVAVGYEDPNYFSRVYKKQFGYPPREGRR